MLLANCTLDDETLQAWQRHWAPPAQPFFISEKLAQHLSAWFSLTRNEFGNSGVPLSLTDTFTTYHVSAEPPFVLWMESGAFEKLSGTDQNALLQEQLEFGRGRVAHLDKVSVHLEPQTRNKLSASAKDGSFVWWPRLWNLLSETEQWNVLRAFIEDDRLPSRHDEITQTRWDEISTVLPGARSLAGTFLPDSGGNCLATVIAAFGTPCIDDKWIHPGPFNRWLARFASIQATKNISEIRDASLGSIIVWRGEDEHVKHVAVSLGNGFLLHKEAQCWFVPRQVSSMAEVLPRWQHEGAVSLYKPI